MAEQLECQAASTGGSAAPGGGKQKPVFDISATAEVAAPLLQLSKQAVVFSYLSDEHGQHPLAMQEPLEIR
jgi:hypothetical protein